jgi:hypothetical protein
MSVRQFLDRRFRSGNERLSLIFRLAEIEQHEPLRRREPRLVRAKTAANAPIGARTPPERNADRYRPIAPPSPKPNATGSASVQVEAPHTNLPSDIPRRAKQR